jgi:hypothetical protein
VQTINSVESAASLREVRAVVEAGAFVIVIGPEEAKKARTTIISLDLTFNLPDRTKKPEEPFRLP